MPTARAHEQGADHDAGHHHGVPPDPTGAFGRYTDKRRRAPKRIHPTIRFPLPGWDTGPLLDTWDHVVRTGDVSARHRFFARVEAVARRAGRGGALDAWGEDPLLMAAAGALPPRAFTRGSPGRHVRVALRCAGAPIMALSPWASTMREVLRSTKEVPGKYLGSTREFS
ncbi:hypothetical protein OG897_28180 [Streptomyces sp. NBC_00237]|uniref:hypothetical protein n=1 Tax=Streptomyces sp. NBC_00237 TaxID=2975687 RepID=UPI00225459E8|nr:hypothetical protein [Streptomyces sp. NBC_00237]MCX5205323.1 hypothetical protein [Streptomyces sp. NBC_00237]